MKYLISFRRREKKIVLRCVLVSTDYVAAKARSIKFITNLNKISFSVLIAKCVER